MRLTAIPASALLVMGLSICVSHADTPRVPSVDDLLQVRQLGGVAVSPDGPWVAYTVTETDFKQDAFVTHVWVAHVASGRDLPADARRRSRAGSPQWSPDGRVARVHQHPRRRQEPDLRHPARRRRGRSQLTKAENGVGGFAWSPDGKQHRLHGAASPTQKAVKDRKDHLGDFEVVRGEYTLRAPLDPRRRRGAERAGRRHAAHEGQDVPAVASSPGRPTARASRSARRRTRT